MTKESKDLGILTVNEDGSITIPDAMFTTYGWELDDDIIVEQTESGSILISNPSYLERLQLGGA